MTVHVLTDSVSGGTGGTGVGNDRVLKWNATSAAYDHPEWHTDTTYPREFVGPVDPATVGTISGPVFADRWTPTGIGPVTPSSPAGVGSSFDLHEDPVTGWPPRPAGYAGGLWIGWTDPTALMSDLDRFIAIPEPV